MILLFAGGLVAGACGGFFVLGMVSAARYADCLEPGSSYPGGNRPHDGSGQHPAAGAEIQRRR